MLAISLLYILSYYMTIPFCSGWWEISFVSHWEWIHWSCIVSDFLFSNSLSIHDWHRKLIPIAAWSLKYFCSFLINIWHSSSSIHQLIPDQLLLNISSKLCSLPLFAFNSLVSHSNQFIVFNLMQVVILFGSYIPLNSIDLSDDVNTHSRPGSY